MSIYQYDVSILEYIIFTLLVSHWEATKVNRNLPRVATEPTSLTFWLGSCWSPDIGSCMITRLLAAPGCSLHRARRAQHSAGTKDLSWHTH